MVATKKSAKDRSKKSRSQLTKTDRAAIKQEQAAFIEKINSALPNEHQARIYEAAQSGAGRYVVLAGPGSGKTFTSIKMSTCFTGKSIYFSYNRKIATDANDKLVAIDSPMVATTAHAFGLQCLIGFVRGEVKVDEKEEKYRALVKKYLDEHWSAYVKERAEEIKEAEADVEVLRLDAEAWALDLIHFAMVSLTAPTPEGLAALVEDFDLADITPASLCWDCVCQVVVYALDEGVKLFVDPPHVVTFDDMVYLPNVVPGVPVRQYDNLIVDEAQDTSRASLELMLRACHANSQVFFIGDPKQSIYVFAGADFDSVRRIVKRLDARMLPLRICYRCGSDIVDLANQLCDEDEKLVSAGLHTGSVQVVGATDYLDLLKPGNAVIGRTTQQLVKGCLRVLRTGKRARVLGKNLGSNIAAVVTKLEAMRIERARVLAEDLSNLSQVLDLYKATETDNLKESRKYPDLAIAEMEDKVETVRAFFEAYLSKCRDEGRRALDDPKCAYNQTAKDFKSYITGLFTEEEGAKDFILFMTAHRSKGGEWEEVYIIGPDEFPHPKAKSDRQRQQEHNLMYVAVTRAIKALSFVGKPFSCLSVPGYELEEEQSRGLTIISAPSIEHVEVYPARTGEEYPLGFEDYEPDVVDTLFHDTIGIPREELHHDAIEVASGAKSSEPAIDATVIEMEPEVLAEGRTSRVVAIEVLCPACGGICVDRALESQMITYDLVGHIVICSDCRKPCIVPLNAFSLQSSSVVAREQPTGVTTKREKVGRTPKERKSKAGRKTKGQGVRQPMQLSLDRRVIDTLNTMGVNKSELFEELLRQYEPFLDAWFELGHDDELGEEDEELDHDEING